MRFALFLLLCPCALSQMIPMSAPHGQPPLPDLLPSLSITSLLLRTDNFLARMPGGIAVEIRNTGAEEIQVILVLRRLNGEHDSRIIFLPAGQKVEVQKEVMANCRNVFVMSMQRFTVVGLEPIVEQDPGSRYVPVQLPQTRRTLVRVRGISQKVRTLGVDEKGVCHYPIFGEKVGIWEDGHVHLFWGGVLKEVANPIGDPQ